MTKKSAKKSLFLNDGSAMAQTSLRRADVVFLYSVLALIACCIVWAGFTPITVTAYGMGEVIPSVHSQIVQATEQGQLQELMVREGSVVKKGDILMRMSAATTTDITSPIDGVVNNIALSTVGASAYPEMALAEIVPADDGLTIRAHILPLDISFLKTGQRVRITFPDYEAYYGDVEGELVHIGAANLKDEAGKSYFEVEVHTPKNHVGDKANPLPVTSGMKAKIYIVTGEKTILDYVMKPWRF